jgi:hypothetical protein
MKIIKNCQEMSGNAKNDTQYKHKIEIYDNFKPVLPFWMLIRME